MPVPGLEIARGANRGGQFATGRVIDAPVDSIVFPALSLATAVTVWDPGVNPYVSQDMEYGNVRSSDPMATPLSLNVTPAMPFKSLAVAESVTRHPEVGGWIVGAETVGAV